MYELLVAVGSTPNMNMTFSMEWFPTRVRGRLVCSVFPEMSVDWDWSWLALRLAGHLGHAGVVSTVSTSSIVFVVEVIAVLA